jgi:hypothetical protein
MNILRVLYTLIVIAAAYVSEEYISAETAFIKVGDLHSLEWVSILHTIAIAIPIAVGVVLVVIWWEPLFKT